ncbi:unnamed protein product [Amoebophrya sp. A120]|nr:unnamed protein product [Amoebophrya sp. A120]|eukprot:GSA120T00001071001.1
MALHVSRRPVFLASVDACSTVARAEALCRFVRGSTAFCSARQGLDFYTEDAVDDQEVLSAEDLVIFSPLLNSDQEMVLQIMLDGLTSGSEEVVEQETSGGAKDHEEAATLSSAETTAKDQMQSLSLSASTALEFSSGSCFYEDFGVRIRPALGYYYSSAGTTTTASAIKTNPSTEQPSSPQLTRQRSSENKYQITTNNTAQLLTTTLIEIEQEMRPVLVLAHDSIFSVLRKYFERGATSSREAALPPPALHASCSSASSASEAENGAGTCRSSFLEYIPNGADFNERMLEVVAMA